MTKSPGKDGRVRLDRRENPVRKGRPVRAASLVCPDDCRRSTR